MSFFIYIILSQNQLIYRLIYEGRKFMKNLKEYIVFIFPVILIFLSVLCLPLLPAQIPIQFRMNGEVTSTLSKYLAIWILPSIECLLIIRYKKNKKIFLYLFLLFLSCIQIAVILLSII